MAATRSVRRGQGEGVSVCVSHKHAHTKTNTHTHTHTHTHMHAGTRSNNDDHSLTFHSQQTENMSYKNKSQNIYIRTGALFLIKQEKNLFKKLSPEICHYFDKQTHFTCLPDSRPRFGNFYWAACQFQHAVHGQALQVALSLSSPREGRQAKGDSR